MEVLLDALWDTLKLFPFLFLIYVLIEILERRTSLTQNKNVLQGPLAPVIGSATGLIPQCGFSVMAAKIYDKGLIRTGTILAVFIATSDEALIILLSDVSSAHAVMPLILIKLVFSVGAGYLVNFILSGETLADAGIPRQEPAHFCCSEHEGGLAGEGSEFKEYFLTPFLHSLKIWAYLFIVNLVFGYVIALFGEENIATAIGGGPFVQPLITALVGLIPNCASSVILTGAYINNAIFFGSLVGGLCSNAGLGLVVLFRNTKKLKRNILIVITLYVIAVVCGICVNGVMILTNMI